MAVFSLLPTIIPGLFDNRFLTEAWADEKEIKKTDQYIQLSGTVIGMKEQITVTEKNAEELYLEKKITEQELETTKDLCLRMDHEVDFADLRRFRRL